MQRLTPRQRRAAFEQLTRDRLGELTEHFDLDVTDRRVVGDHVDALVRGRRVDFEEVLRMLMREELQRMCSALGLDTSGREKDALIRRIMGLATHSGEDSGPVAMPPVALVPSPIASNAQPPPSWGIATPLSNSSSFQEPLRLRTDGPCVTETLNQLERGFAGKPMARPVLERIRRQSEDVLSEILRAYATDAASGEVGAHGTARAANEPPLAGACPTGLLYGRIQSGKTNAMIVTTALAIDNGFRSIVVFTSNFVKLVEQTLQRFKVLDGPLIYSSTESRGGSYQWEQDLENIRTNIGQTGLVLICAKDATHQRSLLDLLKNVGAPNYPALIFDDEADQATPDTTTAARGQQRANAPQHGSVTFRLTVENDASGELGESTREILRHNVFVQVTATPYALLLQNIDSPLRPKFTRLLEPGDGYTGGEHFFTADHIRAGAPPLIYVDEEEVTALADGSDDIPDGLAKAIAFFLLSASAHQHVSGTRDPEGYKFLCHTSPKTVEHEQAGKLIRKFIDDLSGQLPDSLSPRNATVFAWAHGELLRSFPQARSLPELLAWVKHKIHLRRVLTINSASAEADFGASFNFMVGGNILGRGLTIDNLLTTYYLRSAKTTQMDTMLQHARMYGYRKSLMSFLRVFLPHSLAVRFHNIHEAETTLRSLLAEQTQQGKLIPVRVAGGLRATRKNILDVDNIGAFRPGQQVYPTQPEYRQDKLGSLTERIDKQLREAYGDPLPNSEFLPIELERIIDFVKEIRVAHVDEGDWDPDALQTVLRAIGADYNGQGYLFVREFRSERRVLEVGAISGAEHEKARSTEKPVLFLLREPGGSERWAGVPFWYPTVVFPRNMSVQVFNVSQ